MIVLVALAAGISAYFILRQQPTQYDAVTTVQIGTFVELPNPSIDAVAKARTLLPTYMLLARTSNVLLAVIDRGKLPVSTGTLDRSIKIALIPDTVFFTVTATSTSPELAVQMANAMAEELVARSPGTLDEERKAQIERLKKQIAVLEEQLDRNNQQLEIVDKALREGVGDIAALTAMQTDLTNRISSQQTNLAQLQNNLIVLQGQGSLNSLKVLEPARVTRVSVGSNPLRDAIIAAIGGGGAVVALLITLQSLSTSVKEPSQLIPVTNFPIVGIVPTFGNKRTLKDRLVVSQQPQSRAAEAYRVLRTNLTVLAKSRTTFPFSEPCYIIASSKAGEGKSVTASNLAASFALAGQTVALIDANFRSPALHRLFGLSNSMGLSDILLTDRGITWTAGNVPLHRTSIPKLSVITAGAVYASNLNFLQNPHLVDLIDLLRYDLLFDVIIFDTPSALEFSDTIELANTTKGTVVLVVEAGRTRRAEVVSVVERFSMLSIRIFGSVINRSESTWVNLVPLLPGPDSTNLPAIRAHSVVVEGVADYPSLPSSEDR
ncbi:MAG: P-loop NTPase [Anaerolineae bacterium]|nr:P-loop NTPase [Anaerolineae bacterium]